MCDVAVRREVAIGCETYAYHQINDDGQATRKGLSICIYLHNLHILKRERGGAHCWVVLPTIIARNPRVAAILAQENNSPR